MKNGFFHSWKESLTILIPRNLKLFSMAAINAFIKALKPFSIYFSAFIAFWLLYDIACRTQAATWCEHFYYPAFFIFALINIGIAAAIRPSTQLKNCAYFRSLWFQIITASIFYFAYIVSIEWLSSTWYGFLVLPFILMPMVLFSVFFILDAPQEIMGIFRAIRRAILFVLYNYPFIFISTFLFFVIFSIFFFVLSYAAHLVGITLFFVPVLQLIGIFFLMSWFSILYTKRVYEQYEKYK